MVKGQPLGLWEQYRLRLRRKRLLIRALRKALALKPVANRTGQIRRRDVLLFATLRNERIRLPYFLQYYRDLGIGHFLFVDNGSDDGSRDYLAAQPDVSVWTTTASYKRARFGMDWINWLLRRYGRGHWTLTVDLDEFLVYPFYDTRPIRALTDWLDSCEARSFPAMLLDMYPKGPVDAVPYQEGQNPFEIARWFDSGNYTITKNDDLQNLWIQGGPRARLMFADAPRNAPALNKIPLVKWRRGYVYASSTHMLLPRGLNRVYDAQGGEKISGCLLHAKFLSTMTSKVQEELVRREHYIGSREYIAYSEALETGPDMWCKHSVDYRNWRQLEDLGLMSKGNWA